MFNYEDTVENQAEFEVIESNNEKYFDEKINQDNLNFDLEEHLWKNQEKISQVKQFNKEIVLIIGDNGHGKSWL